MAKYRNKGIIEAIQFNGENQKEIIDFIGEEVAYTIMPKSITDVKELPDEAVFMVIPVFGGENRAYKGDYITKMGTAIYLCGAEVFELNYEIAE